MTGILKAFDKANVEYKEICRIEEKFRTEFGNPTLTADKIKEWIKYQLLFYHPKNPATRRAANILQHQDDEPGIECTLVYDELLKLDKKSQNNYRKLLESFEPAFNPGKKPRIPYDSPEWIFSFFMDIFVGKGEYDEKKFEEFFATYPEERLGYQGYYKLCKPYLRTNEVNAYMEKKRQATNMKENRSIELYIHRLDRAIEEFLDHRGMVVDVYKIAETRLSVGY